MSNERKWISSNGSTNVYPGMRVLVLNSGETWKDAVLLNKKGGDYPYCTTLGNFEYCIPLKDNEHRVGTRAKQQTTITTGGSNVSGKKWIASDGSELKPGMMVLVRDDIGDIDGDRWTVTVFSYYQAGDFPYLAATGNYGLCIPLEGNEHMAGTTLPIPQKEKPFEWGEKVLVWNDGKEDMKYLAIFNRFYAEHGVFGKYGAYIKGGNNEMLFHHCIRAPLDTTDDKS